MLWIKDESVKEWTKRFGLTIMLFCGGMFVFACFISVVGIHDFVLKAIAKTWMYFMPIGFISGVIYYFSSKSGVNKNHKYLIFIASLMVIIGYLGYSYIGLTEIAPLMVTEFQAFPKDVKPLGIEYQTVIRLSFIVTGIAACAYPFFLMVYYIVKKT